ncbi:hypothetical protein ACFQ69_02500 [Streptomyces sp. NPDC056470]|uniref:hypothetical protein n=1 Tax=Streptomyces sp. NPDC056470 TaxID=3345831 RepID=UPI0036B0C2C3
MGYSGICVQMDGTPSDRLPLLLAAYQHRFKRNLESMTQHLVDSVTIGWDELGTDLLDGAPPWLVTALTGGAHWLSRPLVDVITPDGSPPRRMTVTDATVREYDVEWGYILHPHGIEVIGLEHQDIGPVVDWDTDPRTLFSNTPALWSTTVPVVTPVRSAAPRSVPSARPAPASPRAVARRQP